MIHFEEQQRFEQWWLWAILGVVAIAIIIPIASDPDFLYSFAGVLALGLLGLGLLFFYLTRLHTAIDSDVITVRFRPLVSREIRWQDVAKAEVLDYGFVGGWGLRLSYTYGTVYNTSGSKGLALTLKNGKKLCIGTQREDRLRKVVRAAKQLHGI